MKKIKDIYVELDNDAPIGEQLEKLLEAFGPAIKELSDGLDAIDAENNHD